MWYADDFPPLQELVIGLESSNADKQRYFSPARSFFEEQSCAGKDAAREDHFCCIIWAVLKE